MIVRPLVLACLVLASGFAATAAADDPPEIDEETQSRLDAPVTLRFPELTPLDRVLEAAVAASKGLAITVDRGSLKQAGVDESPMVKIDVENVPLKAALTQLVRPLKLVYTVKNGSVTVVADPYRDPDPAELEARMKKEDVTAYAPGYSEEKFRAIQPGATEAAVHKLVGKPLREVRSRPEISWYYGPPTLRVAEDGGLFDTSGQFDPAWGFTVARAHADGKIFEILGGYFDDVPKELIGADLSQMKKHYGEPVAIHENRATRHLIYTAPKALGSFRTRVLGLDASGKVVQIIAGYVFD